METTEHEDHGQQYEADAQRDLERGNQHKRAKECYEIEHQRFQMDEQARRGLTSETNDKKGARRSGSWILWGETTLRRLWPTEL